MVEFPHCRFLALKYQCSSIYVYHMYASQINVSLAMNGINNILDEYPITRVEEKILLKLINAHKMTLVRAGTVPVPVPTSGLKLC